MTLYEKIIAEFPELEGSAEFISGCIRLQNDGENDYIAKWEYEKPLPKSLEQFLIQSDVA